MNLYVLDASAWVRLFLGDGPLPAGLEVAGAEVDRGNAVFAAPELILIEAAHALHRKVQRRDLTAHEADAVWADMQGTPLDLIGAREHIEQARVLAAGGGLSVYDALYLALARHLGVHLFTADAKLARAASG